jgi:hypothetical protein
MDMYLLIIGTKICACNFVSKYVLMYLKWNIDKLYNLLLQAIANLKLKYISNTIITFLKTFFTKVASILKGNIMFLHIPQHPNLSHI